MSLTVYLVRNATAPSKPPTNYSCFASLLLHDILLTATDFLLVRKEQLGNLSQLMLL